MLFELKTETECTLTSFTGRTQKEGPKADKPAVSFNLKLCSVSNVIIDMLSATMRHTVYAPVEGQEQLPEMERTTPILRSKDLKRWQCETVHNGWTVTLARGINESSALQMGSCKVDAFDFDFYEGGHVDLEFRVSTADLDEAGAGMLWGRQKCKVFVTVEAPEVPKPAIDGSVGHPGLATQKAAAAADATDLFAAAQAGDVAAAAGADSESDDDGGGHAEQPLEPERGENWPFPKRDAPTSQAEKINTEAGAAAEQAALEAGMARSIKDAGVKPARRARKATVHAE